MGATRLERGRPEGAHPGAGRTGRTLTRVADVLLPGAEPEHRRPVEEQQHHQPPPFLTGRDRQAGARGRFSLTGQPNAMGGREAGLLGAGGVAGLPGSPRTPGIAAEESRRTRDAPRRRSRRGRSLIGRQRCPGALEAGRLKAIWIAATNPAVSLGVRPGASGPRRAPVQGRTDRRPGPLPPDRDDPVRGRPAPGGRNGQRRRAPTTSSERLVSPSASRSSSHPARPCPGLADPGPVRPGDGLLRVPVRGLGARSGTSSSS